MSQVLGGALGLVADSARPTVKDYWKAFGMYRGSIVNPYYWQADKMSQVLGGTLGLVAESAPPTLKGLLECLRHAPGHNSKSLLLAGRQDEPRRKGVP